MEGTSMKAIIVFLLLCTTATCQFPVAPLGMCYDGVHILAGMYTGHQVQYACNAPVAGSQGHVWCLVDGQPIDSYYGPMAGDEWEHPQFLYNSLEELDAGIDKQTSYIESPVGSGNWVKA